MNLPDPIICLTGVGMICTDCKWLWVKAKGTILGVGAPPHFRTYFSGDWAVHFGYGILAHGQIMLGESTVLHGATQRAGLQSGRPSLGACTRSQASAASGHSTAAEPRGCPQPVGSGTFDAAVDGGHNQLWFANVLRSSAFIL